MLGAFAFDPTATIPPSWSTTKSLILTSIELIACREAPDKANVLSTRGNTLLFGRGVFASEPVWEPLVAAELSTASPALEEICRPRRSTTFFCPQAASTQTTATVATLVRKKFEILNPMKSTPLKTNDRISFG